MRNAGLRDVEWNIFQPVHADVPYARIQAITMDRIRAAVVDQGFASRKRR